MSTPITGRRKTSVARVQLKAGKGSITINKKDLRNYFSTPTLQESVQTPISFLEKQGEYDIIATVKGGGITGQAEALRLAIARHLVHDNPDFRPLLKQAKLLTRDHRCVERKKYGRRKARKKFQFSKR